MDEIQANKKLLKLPKLLQKKKKVHSPRDHIHSHCYSSVSKGLDIWNAHDYQYGSPSAGINETLTSSPSCATEKGVKLYIWIDSISAGRKKVKIKNPHGLYSHNK